MPHSRPIAPPIAAVLFLAAMFQSPWTAEGQSRSSKDSAQAYDFMIRVEVDDEEYEGSPISWDKMTVRMLTRDGRLVEFSPSKAGEFKKTSPRFQPLSSSELRAELLRELGSGYEVSGAGRYVVAHPKGQRSQWVEAFDDLYREFERYFRVRRFNIQPPKTPLIAIICKDYRDFINFSRRQGVPAGGGVLGYYSITSNRLVLFDQAAGDASRTDARAASMDTVIHEATHQAAYNTGVHSRYVQNPLWIVEGIATLFEAEGVRKNDARGRQNASVNPVRLRDFKSRVQDRGTADELRDMIRRDSCFQRQAMTSYAMAWALTYYLMETQPAKFSTYLRRISAREAFKPYSATERQADFEAVFGDDWPLMHAQFMRYMKGVK